MWATHPPTRRTPNRRGRRHENQAMAGGAGDGVAVGASCLLSVVDCPSQNRAVSLAGYATSVVVQASAKMKAVNTVTMRIEGMHCEGCAERITLLLEKEPGARDATASFADGQARVQYNPHAVHEGRLVEVVEAAGFCSLADNHD